MSQSFKSSAASVDRSDIIRLSSASGLTAQINANGSLQRMDCGDIVINLFPGNELEGGCTNLYLRNRTARRHVALLGPDSSTCFVQASEGVMTGMGEWDALRYRITLTLAASAPVWFWHVAIENAGAAPCDVDLLYAQDIALAPYGAARINEFYVSQYVDHTPLDHATHGVAVASRQNQAVSGRFPWSIIGSLTRATSYSTDALQFHGLSRRAGDEPPALIDGLPGHRLQHEHSLVALQDEVVRLAAGATVRRGFFGSITKDHATATTPADLAVVDVALSLPEASATCTVETGNRKPPRSLFTSAPLLPVKDLSDADLSAWCASDERGDVERGARGELLSFFYGADRHVVLRAKELQVRRPHGHLLRTGTRATPDESALTSTTWMAGVFHSMVTQGHVSINRFLSTTHSYLGLFRSHGQRVFVELNGAWNLLDVPSACDMGPTECRWIYRHAAGVIEVRSKALSDPHALTLELHVIEGPASRFLITHHIALNGDDGSLPGMVEHTLQEGAVVIRPTANSELRQRFPNGAFRIVPLTQTNLAQTNVQQTDVEQEGVEQIGGDELLFSDGQSRQQPFVCIITRASNRAGLRLQGELVDPPAPEAIHGSTAALGASEDPASLTLQIKAPVASALAKQVARIQHIIPWFTHNALIHYLSPRGLEQYSGGGWGTRDVSQGPVELLLACGNTRPVRDLLLRVFSAQNPDGDWPQWFMFFERERHIRAGDSHGDIVFWPVLALAQYLIASGDASLLAERVTFFHQDGVDAGEPATIEQHMERSLLLIEQRVIAGTALAAYGHGDWNDSLQPADPTMREHMCSAWTVTLHHQMLTTLALALRHIGRKDAADRLDANAAAVKRDFQRLLLVDGVLTGYAFFDSATDVRYLLHPRDATSGVRYSSLAMIHAILEGMLSPEQARTHLHLMDEHLTGPDGVRLFDQPMPYHGGPMRFFQRAESATFFGREIGLMYMHAHLRYAQALAHLGEADRFFKALCQSNPIGLSEIVPQATLRQSNCYYSSSDAVFADRVEASEHYDRVAAGSVALDGGWRVYSSGAGIALGLIVRRFLGLTFDARVVLVDPVIPPALNGLRVRTTVLGRETTLIYHIDQTGSGVVRVTINGKAMPVRFADNPYRKGAAVIDRDTLSAALHEGENTIDIELA